MCRIRQDMKDGSNILRILPALCADPAYPVNDLLKELDYIRIKAHKKFFTRNLGEKFYVTKKSAIFFNTLEYPCMGIQRLQHCMER